MRQLNPEINAIFHQDVVEQSHLHETLHCFNVLLWEGTQLTQSILLLFDCFVYIKLIRSHPQSGPHGSLIYVG